MSLLLQAGGLSLALQPDIGGSVRAFRLQRGDASFDLMRVARGASALYSGKFPMVPFANCIRDNRFDLGGKSYGVTPNMAEARLNFHGSGWLSAWAVSAQSAREAELVLADGRVDDVYRYEARQRYLLNDEGLSVTLTLANRGAETMPFSFGLHPWFPRHGNGVVRFTSDGRWRGDGDGQALALEPQAGGGEYGQWREPPRDWQNFCHTGWNGVAEIDWPEAGMGLRIEADPVLAHLMVHVPASGEAVFCLEPQSNAPCAFDELAEGQVAMGVHVLKPGEAVSGTIRFIPTPGQASWATR